MNVKEHEAELGFLYAGLGDGQTEAGALCPACKGGTSKERTLSVTRRGSLLLYKCHRASCPFNGAFTVGRLLGKGEREHRPRASYPSLGTYPLDKEHFELLATKFRITREMVENSNLTVVRGSDQRFSGRICIPIHGPDSKERGRVYRSFEPGQTPKTINELKSPDDPAFAWYKWLRRSRTLVLVEDQLSAIRLAPHCHSAALLGTNLSEAKVEEIKDGKYEHVYICLDNDATRVAICHQLRWRNTIPGLLIHGLGKDVKNMNTEELDRLLFDFKGVNE